MSIAKFGFAVVRGLRTLLGLPKRSRGLVNRCEDAEAASSAEGPEEKTAPALAEGLDRFKTLNFEAGMLRTPKLRGSSFLYRGRVLQDLVNGAFPRSTQFTYASLGRFAPLKAQYDKRILSITIEII